MTGKHAKRRLLILGASGHGRVVADCARATGLWSEFLFFDDRWPTLTTNADWPVAGGTHSVADHASADDDVFVAIGNAHARLRFLDHLSRGRLSIATIVHPRAIVSEGASVGCGTLVAPGAVLNFGVTTGEGCIVNTSSSVDHDCTLSQGVHICPGAHLAGTVNVGRAAWIGIGAVVRQNMRIGSDSTVGAGAVVVSDVAPNTTVIGCPAKPMRKKS